MYSLLKKCLFQIDPEIAHNLIIQSMNSFPFVGDAFCQSIDENSDKYTCVGKNMSWPFPIGLAAGLDKDARAVSFLSKLYFGAIEVGTVTPLPQEGNPKPRLFRYPNEENLRNQMGFNNHGMEEMRSNLLHQKKKIKKKLGINIGKNKITPGDEAWKDYQKSYEYLKDLADYIVVNVSSPNTPGLRDLQTSKGLEEILKSIGDVRREDDPPLFVKVSPDLNLTDLDSIIDLVNDFNTQGLIATNTTIAPEYGTGGMSGKILYSKGKEIRSHILKRIRKTQMDLVGVGGFSNFNEIFDFWEEGGTFVQIYSSFIFQGPQLLKDIKIGIDSKLTEYKVNSLSELFQKLG